MWIHAEHRKTQMYKVGEGFLLNPPTDPAKERGFISATGGTESTQKIRLTHEHIHHKLGHGRLMKQEDNMVKQ